MTFSQFLAQLTVAIVPILASALVAYLGAGAALLIVKIKAHFGAQRAAAVNRYTDILQNVADKAMLAMQQSVVDGLKASGKWDKETADQIKKQAVDLGLSMLGSLKDQMMQQAGIDVPAWLSAAIELSLRNYKLQDAAAQISAQNG